MDGKVDIITPESVQLSYDIAGIGSRFMALLLDTLIQVVLIIIGIVSLNAAGATLGDASGSLLSWYTALMIMFVFIVFIGYFIFFEMILRGRTPGKAAVKIRVIKKNGQPLTFTASLVRNIFRIVDMLPGLYGIGIISMFANSDSRRIGDLAASTIVVKEYGSKITSIADFQLKETSRVYNAYPLTNGEYSLLKEFLSCREKLFPEKRWELAFSLSNRFYDKFHIPQEDRTDREKFLEALAESNSR
jgi:uncharacterized RDD family membrane protein YckC